MSRRVAREKALQVLYQAEIGGTALQDALAYSMAETSLAPVNQRFAEALVMGAWEDRQSIDYLISKHTRRWKIERLAVIDKNILRLAVFEMTRQADIPHEVSIDEAVELAKKFSTDKAASFINGILDSISKEINGEQPE